MRSRNSTGDPCGERRYRVTGPVDALNVGRDYRIATISANCPNRGAREERLVAAGPRSRIGASAVHHISVAAKLDWSALIDRRRRSRHPANLARSMANPHVEVIRGHAVFVSPMQSASAPPLGAKHIVIATGSKPRPLQFQAQST